MTNSLSYKDAGVDIDAGNRLVQRIKRAAQSTARSGSASELGGFGGLFDLAATGYIDPLLVAATDGVGTKLRLAIESGNHTGVGIDLVAMCVNDLLVQGAEPLFFLDYFATGALDVDQGQAIVQSIAEGCIEAGCALIGGETAEMPGMYHGKDYDLAGFSVGAVERNALLPREDVKVGDVIIGLPSSGIHSNGFSLVRRVLKDGGYDLAAPAPFDPEHSLADALLAPTRIYIRSCLPLAKAGHIKAMAHITGGGLTENIPRVLPDGTSASLRLQNLTLPPVFQWLKDAGNIAMHDMLTTFNCGIGLVLIIAPEQVASVERQLREAGESPRIIGEIISHTGKPDVRYIEAG